MTGKTEQMKTTGKNLLKPNDHNVYHELPLKAGTVVTLMTNGQLSEGGNIKFIGMENENVWFAIDKGRTRVCHSIGNKDVKGFYNLLTKKEGLEYMLAIGDVKIFEPYSGGFPSPSPDWEQPIEITDQPVTVTIKGGTEQQSITLTPPHPFTKWDKLEKVDGVWCWVYQHNEYTVTGEETFAIGNEAYVKGSSTNCYINGLKKAAKNKNEAMERLPRIDLIWSKPGDVGFALNESQLHMRLPNFLLGVSDDATASEKIAAYKAYVKAEYDKGTPYHVIYETTTPESIPISPSEQTQLNALTMYAPETEVTNTGGCNMDLTYTVDTKSYVDSKIAAISAAVLEV